MVKSVSCVMMHRYNLVIILVGGLTLGIWNFNLQSSQTQVCHSFLSSDHPNNCLENISIFHLLLFKSLAKKSFR